MPPPADDLRAKLKALGYLDAGLDRFVLAPVREDRGPGGIALRSSLRIGVLAAALLGPATALGMGSRLPGLVTSAGDALIVAAYLGVLLGAAVGLAALVSAWSAGRLMQRRLGARSSAGGDRLGRAAGRLSGAAGALISLGCLVYLTFWWRAADAAFGWSSPARTALALAVAVAISVLLGHATRLTALGVAAHATGDGADLRRRRSWRASAALGVLAFAGAAALLLATAPRQPTAALSTPPEFAVLSTGVRLTVVALDGFNVALYRRLAEAGEVPNLSGVLEASRIRIDAAAGAGGGRADGDPARVWTSVATGLPAAAHGIAGLQRRRVAGLQGAVATDGSLLGAAVSAATDLLRLTRPTVASAVERREKAFWEVAAERGLRTVVVNWWATWPADPPGTVISERAVLRLEHGGALEGEIGPPELYDTLRDEWPALRARADAALTGRFGSVESADVLAVLRRSAELDYLQVALATHGALGETDLLAVYLPGLDIAQHGLFGDEAGRTPLTPIALAERLEALQEYYRFLDALAAPLTRPADPSDLIALVTHPGRVPDGGPALLALQGRGVQPRIRGEAAISDIAPTFLFALGLPASQELTGRPITDLFEAAFVQRYPVRLVASYGRRLVDERGRSPELDREMLERLRSLGYVR